MSHSEHHSGLLGVDPKMLGQLLTTRPFKFVVGHSAIVFFIHQGVVSRLSAPLNAIVNSRGTESPEEDCVVWKDIDAIVFSRFAQFAYTGTYTSSALAATSSSEGVFNTTVNAAEMLPDRSNPEKPLFQGLFSCTTPLVGVGDGSVLPRPQETDTTGPFKLPYSLASYERAALDKTNSHSHSELCGRSHSGSLFGPKRKRDMPCDCGLGTGGGPSAKKQNLISEFMTRQAGAGSSTEQRILPTEPASAMFVENIKIFGFAERFSIPSLMDLACSHLVWELVHWTISPSTFVPEFGALVRCVYDERTIKGRQLQQLVVQFATCVVEDVLGLAGWLQLLDDVPTFAADLINQMTNRFG